MRRGRLPLAAIVALTLFAALPTAALAAPDTSITGGPAEGSTILGPTATFTFTSTAGPDAVFRCSVDGAAPAACTSPFTTPALAFGAHSFSVASAPFGTMDFDLSPAIVNFRVVPPIGVLRQTPVEILTTTTRLSKDGSFGVDVKCPDSAGINCSGTMGAGVGCCGKVHVSDLSISIQLKSLFAKKRKGDVRYNEFTIEPGTTATATAKAKTGKSGKPNNGRALPAAAGKVKVRGVVTSIDFRVIQRGGVPTLPGSELTAQRTIKVQQYKAKQGSSGRPK